MSILSTEIKILLMIQHHKTSDEKRERMRHNLLN
jgi:hypothetical protein